MSILKLDNGQYRGFTELQVAYDMAVDKNITDPEDLARARVISDKIMSANITAGLQYLTPAEERAIIYSDNHGWSDVLEFIKKMEG